MLTAWMRGCYSYDWGNISVYRTVENIFSGDCVVEAKSRRNDYGSVAGIRRRNPG